MSISDQLLVSGLQHCGLNPASFSASGQTSLRGPCIKCGGARRMVVFLNGQFPKWYLRCDLCGLEGWAPSLFPGVKWPDGPVAPLPSQQPKDYSRSIAVLQEKRLDVALHEHMTEDERQVWRDMGVPDSLQDFYKLGFVRGRPFRKFTSDGVMVVDAYTIPKYNLGWDLRNIDFRLLGAPEAEGKYRPFPGAPPTAFLSRPDLPSLINEDGSVFIMEGSKKAMISSLHLDNRQIIGVPSSNSWAGVAETVKDATVVYVILDPDSWMWGRKLAKSIGIMARQVTLPLKVDDAFLSHSLNKASFERALTFSRREGGGIIR